MNRKNQWVPPPRQYGRRPPSSVRMPVTVLPSPPPPPRSKVYPEKMENGGYNYQFVDEEKLPDECTCPICTLVQREAHQVICCGKIYCKSCLDELKSKSDYFKCPNCRSSLHGENKYFPDKNTITKIRHFAIYCNKKGKGCQWEGLLKDFEEGHLLKCPYQIIVCSNKCGVTLQRQELDRHLEEECPRRQFTCPLCKKWGEYKTITGYHIRTCPDYVLKCPNAGCDERIKRSQMTHHRNACQKERVCCQHSSIGCKTTIKREGLPSHAKEHRSSHLDLAIKEAHKLKRDQEHMSFDLNLAKQEICQLKTQTFKIPVIKMQNYSRNKERWISPGFYVSTSSYKMALKVTTYKWWILEYLSCYLALLPGEYDDTLEWPFQGEVIVELLNQKEDKNHMNKIIYFNKDTPEQYKKRVVRSREIGGWWGQQHVIEKQALDPYLSDNDTLYFRISVKTNKSWLV